MSYFFSVFYKSSFVASLFIPIFTNAGMVYTPSHFSPDTAKIVVVIHGCLQSAEAMALGTGWNQIADKNNLVIVYPQVPEGAHPISCWSWYLPENQRSDSGQLKSIQEEIQQVTQNLKLKNPDVFVTGMSSGAITTAGLIACFPNTFKAAAIHSGTSYGLAQNIKEAEKVLKDGPPSDPVPKLSCQTGVFSGALLVIHGSSDPVVNPRHALRIISDFVGPNKATATQDLKEGGLFYTISDYDSGKSTKGRLILVQSLGHSWSGYNDNIRHKEFVGPKATLPTQLPFFSELGPSSTQLIWNYFQQNSTVKSKVQ